MKHRQRPPSVATLVVAACALLTGATAIFPVNSLAQTAPAVAPKRGQPITLNFTNADIEAVARTMATLTGRNVVVDPRVKGTITLNTESPVSPAMAYYQFRTLLRLQGYTVVQGDDLDRVLPEADAKLQSSVVGVSESGEKTASGNQLMTQIIRLQHENANNLVTILRPLISPNNTINVNPGTNSLVITDYADNLRRLARIVAALDVANATGVEVVQLKHANASDLAPLLLRLLESGGTAAGGQADASFKTTVLAEPRSNALILRAANQARLALAMSLIDKLDQPGGNTANGDAGNIYVVYLKNANAVQLAPMLRAAMGSAAGAAATTTSSATPATAAASAAANATGGQIQADPATNALIITASQPQYRQLRAVIDKLDARRAQVFVESLIAEVNADKAAEFGIQWQGVLGKAGDANVGLLGTNFSIGGTNIVKLATSAASGTVSPSTGFNAGMANQVNGVYVLGFLARFLEASGDGNILSTPNLLTLDNEEAKIVIGQNVPFITGQYTNTGASTATVNPFQTIERKDVGLMLRVRPQINENGTVKMAIYQEVSKIDDATLKNANGPTTSKRSIESNVLVEDGSIIVLGGLLEDSYSQAEDKVPLLGDVPIVGNLFRSENRSRKKTNLMVFLRPVVVRDAAASDALMIDRYESIRALQQQVQPSSGGVLGNVQGAPVLPSLRMERSTAPHNAQ